MDVTELLEKAEAIRLDEIDQSFFEGRMLGNKEGWAEGSLERQIKTAHSMLQDDFPLEKIAEYTELSPSEILALQANPPQKPVYNNNK